MKHDLTLLERRLSAGPTAEKQKTQKIIQLFTSAGFIALAVVSALDFRFGWSNMRLEVNVAGDLMTAVGFYIVFLVYRESPFTSATIEIASDQRVISTGSYAVVRHPMYSGGPILLLGTPLAADTGSVLALVVITL